MEQLRNDTEVLRAAEKNIVEAIQNGTHVTEQKLAQGLRNSTNLTSMAEVGKQFTTELVGTGLTIAGLGRCRGITNGLLTFQAAVGIVAPEIVIPASVAGGIALEKASTAATEHAKQDGNSSKAEVSDGSYRCRQLTQQNVSSQAGNSNDDRGEPNSLQ